MNLLVSIALIALPFWLSILRKQRRRYPPGPKRYPLIGSLLDIPKAYAHEKFAQYSKEFGSDIIYIDAAGTPLIILNSLKACLDLLEKRSTIYSSRYHQTMAFELVECRRLFAMLPYNDEWRECRRLMVKFLSSSDQAPILSSVKEFVQKSLIPNLLLTPEDLRMHLRNGIGGAILSLVYGLPIKRVNDPWIALAEQGMHWVTTTTVPGKYAVDVMPFLKYLPEWFPGAAFQKEAKEGREVMREFFSRPFEAAKRAIADGAAQPSFVSRSLEELNDHGDKKYQERTIENVGATFAAGGADTTVTALINVIVVLLLFPEVQKKAQAEIDTVVGKSRLPDLEDKPNLPYLHALLKETLRWKPVVPTGLPHMSTQDDDYKGYFIPKGSIVMYNTWAIMHDEKVFPDPSKFDPYRFLTDSGELRTDRNIPDPEVVGNFGFGRRICPGINVGLASYWLSAASILACFNVSPALDNNGQPEVPRVEYLGKEIVSHPEPFNYRITPRSPDAVALVQAEYDESSEYI